MAYNLGTVRSRIQDKMDNTSFSSSILNQFINDGLREVCIKAKPQFMRAEATYTTSIGSNALTTSSTDILVPLNFRLYTPVNYAHLLPFVEYQDMDLYYPNITLLGTGPPIAWSIFAGTPIAVNRADAVYTLLSKYVQVPPTLVNDSDVPIVPDTFGEVLVLAGYKRALEHDDDFDQAQVIQQQIDSMIMEMTNFLKPQTGVPHIMRSPNMKRTFGVR